MAARKFPIIPVVLLAVSMGLTASAGVAPAGAAAGDSVVLVWNQQVLDTIRVTRSAPTIAARALAVVHTAIYDAWAAYDATAVPTMANGNTRVTDPGQRTDANKTKAISWAAYRVLRNLFPASQFPDIDYDGQMRELFGIDWAADSSADRTIGEQAAAAVIAYREHDGANQLGDEEGTPPAQAGKAYADYTDYQPVNTWDQVKDPDRWQPLCSPCRRRAPPSAPAGSRRS